MGSTQYGFAALPLAVICSRSCRIGLSQSCRQRHMGWGRGNELCCESTFRQAQQRVHCITSLNSTLSFEVHIIFPILLMKAQRGQLNCQNHVSTEQVSSIRTYIYDSGVLLLHGEAIPSDGHFLSSNSL